MSSESNVILQTDIQSPRDLLTLVLGQLTDGLALADSTGTVRYFNGEAERIMGVAAENFSRSSVKITTLEVVSTGPRGTTFLLRLPVEQTTDPAG